MEGASVDVEEIVMEEEAVMVGEEEDAEEGEEEDVVGVDAEEEAAEDAEIMIQNQCYCLFLSLYFFINIMGICTT